MDILIDYRERELIGEMDSPELTKWASEITYNTTNLPVGDILIQTKSQPPTPVCIIERKTYSDYASSISDFRTKNQIERLLQLRSKYPNLIIIYLIEGKCLEEYPGKVDRYAIYSSIANRLIRDNVHVIMSTGVSDTIKLISRLYFKLIEHKMTTSIGTVGSGNESGVIGDAGSGGAPGAVGTAGSGGAGDGTTENVETVVGTESDNSSYLKTLKLSKKDQLTPEIWYLCTLAQIPGVSRTIAEDIAKVYPSLTSLIAAYKENGQDILKNIQLKSRKLGPTISRRIHQYLAL